jgi:hypothetical protein
MVWRERTNDSRMPCCTATGKAWSSVGLIEKLPFTWMEVRRPSGDQQRDPVGEAGDEHRAEERGAERSAQ